MADIARGPERCLAGSHTMPRSAILFSQHGIGIGNRNSESFLQNVNWTIVTTKASGSSKETFDDKWGVSLFFPRKTKVGSVYCPPNYTRI